MKSIIVSSSIILLTVLAVILSSIFISSSLLTLEKEIDDYIISENTDFKQVREDFKRISEKFEKDAAVLVLLVPDSTIYEIRGYFSDIDGYAGSNSLDGLSTSIGRLRVGIKSVKELAEFNICSVL